MLSGEHVRTIGPAIAGGGAPLQPRGVAVARGRLVTAERDRVLVMSMGGRLLQDLS